MKSINSTLTVMMSVFTIEFTVNFVHVFLNCMGSCQSGFKCLKRPVMRRIRSPSNLRVTFVKQEDILYAHASIQSVEVPQRHWGICGLRH